MKKNYSFLLTLLLSLFLPSITSIGQITVTPNQTAAVLASTLVGPGVLMLNPTITCTGAANGTFTGTSSLSFNSGIVLSSGRAIDAARPASFFASTGFGAPGNAQLSALIGGTATNDACMLQFDFRPQGDTIKFQYVFGSEEYTDFTCSPFNDVFAFFISGPGIAGTPNLAIVPGTTIPVCINSVNCGGTGGYSTATCRSLGAGSPFCAYYVNNLAGTTIVYDGLTTTLTAISAVTPCDTYHLKIGIADATDDIYDSGVFLKAGSLTSNSFNSTVFGINPTDTGFGSQFCIRGCAPGMFVFHNTGSLLDSIIIKYQIGGTAVNGVDYTTILDSAIIHAHDSTDTVFIYGLPIPPTGPKTVTLYIYAPYSCGAAPTIIDSVELTIYDSLKLHINTPDTTICIGQDVYINTSADSGYQYTWSPSATLNSNTLLSPTATPSVTTTYTISGTYPGSGCPPKSENVTITVVDPPTLDVGPPIQTTCVGVHYQIGVTVTPASGTYTYNWTPATYLNNGTIANPIVTPVAPGNTEYVVFVGTSVFGCNATDSFLLHVLPNDFNLLSPDTGICFKDLSSYLIRANGDSEFSYHWIPTTGVSNPNIITPIITPPGTTITYTLTATYPGCPDMNHSIEYSIENPYVNILIGDTNFCIGNSIPIPVIVTPIDSPYTLTWSPTNGLSDPTFLEPSFFTLTPGVYTYYLTIQSGLGCTSTDSVTFNPAPPIRMTIHPGNTTIMYGDHLQLEAINLSPTPLNYYWIPDNGTINNPNINDPVVTPVDSSTVYTVYGMNIWGCRDTVSVTINVERTNECIPNAFTPNGDGLNDVFRICHLTYEKLVDFSVFNRWGQLVYHNTNDATKGWDGTYNGVPQDMGVYNYVIIVSHVDGTNKIYKGDVTLIR